jgi:hypothetical protein
VGEKRTGEQIATPAPAALIGPTAAAHPAVPGRQGGHRGIGQRFAQVQVKSIKIFFLKSNICETELNFHIKLLKKF